MKNDNQSKNVYIIFSLLILPSLAISVFSWQQSSKNIVALTYEVAHKNQIEYQQKEAIVKLLRGIEELEETIKNNCMQED